MALIEAKHISYTYPGERGPAFRDISFVLDAGETLAVVGDNGAGKTTLLRVLAGLAHPSEGVYRFDGAPVTEGFLKDNRNAKRFHQRVGFLFQNPDVMLFNGTVYDEVAFGPRQLGLPDGDADRRTRDCLALLGLEGLEDKAPYHLSGGQKKKVALAAVLALNPEVLLLDEPMAGLDKGTRAWLLDFLEDWKGAGKTLVCATHEEDLADRLGARTLAL